MIKKVLLWAVIAFAVFYLFTQPAGAASAVKGAGHSLAAAANHLAQFFSNLSK